MEFCLRISLPKSPESREKMNGVPKETEIEQQNALGGARLLEKMAGILEGH
jgi:hypothetical protein